MSDIVDPVSRLVAATINVTVHASNGVGSNSAIEEEYTAARANLSYLITRLRDELASARAENSELRDTCDCLTDHIKNYREVVVPQTRAETFDEAAKLIHCGCSQYCELDEAADKLREHAASIRSRAQEGESRC